MGASVLEQIVAQRRADVAEAKRRAEAGEPRAAAVARPRASLAAALRAAPAPRIIAEVKKGSPSAGILRDPYEPDEIARGYAAAGAIGISVLMEPRHFFGHPDHLRRVRAAVNLPILCKDFTCDPHQVHEAAALGADVILLIVAAIDPVLLRELHALAGELGLETLVEVHEATELDVALGCPGAIVGVNSRNLKSLKTDLAVARELAAQLPPERLRIAESGIRSEADIADLQARGYHGFLIGESLLRARDPAVKLEELLGRRPR